MSVSQVDAPFTAAGHTFRAGDFVVHTRGNEADHDKLKALVQETGLTAYSISGPSPSVAAARTQGRAPQTEHLDDAGRLDPAASGPRRFPYVSLSPGDHLGRQPGRLQRDHHSIHADERPDQRLDRCQYSARVSGPASAPTGVAESEELRRRRAAPWS